LLLGELRVSLHIFTCLAVEPPKSRQVWFSSVAKPRELKARGHKITHEPSTLFQATWIFGEKCEGAPDGILQPM